MDGACGIPQWLACHRTLRNVRAVLAQPHPCWLHQGFQPCKRVRSFVCDVKAAGSFRRALVCVHEERVVHACLAACASCLPSTAEAGACSGRWSRQPAGQWMMPLDANSSALHAFLAPHGWGPEQARCRGCGPDQPGNAAAEMVAKALAGVRSTAGSFVWATGVMHSAFWTNAALLASAACACVAARLAQAWLAAAVAGCRGRQLEHAKTQ